MDVSQPDEKSIITYVSSLYDAMPRVPDVQDGGKASVSVGRQARVVGGQAGPWRPLAAPDTRARPQELQLRWQEYRELVLLLLQWTRHHTAIFEERRFPSSFEEIEVGWAARGGVPCPPGRWGGPRQGCQRVLSPQILWCQFLKFKETELPAKEADKNRSKGIYQSLEVSKGLER